MVSVVASGRDGEQAELRRGLDGRIHRHAGRVHGLVSGQEDQDGSPDTGIMDRRRELGLVA